MESMGSKILIVNSTVSDGRVFVSFSYPALAQPYKEYLETVENSYDDKHEWRVAITGRQVSFDLAPGITFEFHNDSKDAVLVFEDEATANKWEEKMILWEKSVNQEGLKRSISRSLTVGQVIEKLGVSGQSFRLRHIHAATRQTNRLFSDSLIKRLRGMQN